jgi:hypothetical protein
MSALLELAERCEQATGPDCELNREVAQAAGWRKGGKVWALGSSLQGWAPPGAPSKDLRLDVPHYTASLDAAMTLVPEGWYLGDLTQCNEDDVPQACLTEIDEPCRDAGASASTLALSLCAAALRARAAIAMEARRVETAQTGSTAEGGDSAGRNAASPKQDRP